MSPAENEFATKIYKSFDLSSDNSLAELYSGLLETIEPWYIAFVKLDYFRNLKGAINRYQDIPEEYFTVFKGDPMSIATSAGRIFISHKWQTKEHPDPNRKSLNLLLACTKDFNGDTSIWWDFCCLPQRNPIDGTDDRSTQQKAFFKFQLPLISHIILETRQLILWEKDGLNSGWCCIENIIANVLLQDLNKLVNDGKSLSHKDSFLTVNVQGKTLSERKNKHVRIYTNEIANQNYNEIMQWFQKKLNYVDNVTSIDEFYYNITQDMILEMIDNFNLTFTNGSDKDFVSNLLFKIFKRLGDKTINTIQLGGEFNYFLFWHDIRGTYGNCVMPSFDYDF